MNLTLKKQLQTAYEFYRYQEEHYYVPIRKNRDIVSQCKYAFKNRQFPKSPVSQMEDQNVKDILLLLFLWPVGIVNMYKHKKEKAQLEVKANVQYAEEMFLYEKFCCEMKENIHKALSAINRLETERKVFEQTNGNCVAFLPSCYHNLWDVRDLLSYVSAGRADSIKEAANLMIADRQREEDIERENWYFERSMEQREKFHNETMGELREIQRKQDAAAEQRRDLQRTVSDIHREIIR